MKMHRNKKKFNILIYVILFFIIFSIDNLLVKAITIKTGSGSSLFSYKIEKLGLYSGIKAAKNNKVTTEYKIGNETITLPPAVSNKIFTSKVHYRVFNDSNEQLYCIEQGVGFSKSKVSMSDINKYLFIRTTKIPAKDGKTKDLLCDNSCNYSNVEDKISCETKCRKKLISQVISVGYHNLNPTKSSEKYKNIATQELIWEISRGERILSSFSEKPVYEYMPNSNCKSNGKYCPFYTEINKNNKNGRKDILSNYKDIINKVYYTYYNTPKSFSKTMKDAKTIELTTYSNNKFTATFNSKYYEKYKDFEFETSDNSVVAKLNDDVLTITSTKSLNKAVLITATYKYQSDSAKLSKDDNWKFRSKRASGTAEQALAIGSAKVSYYLKVETPKYCIKITKNDYDSKKGLKGAIFSICSDSKCKNIIKSGLTTGNDGTVLHGDITKPGTYYVKETKAPNGYKNSDTNIQKVVVSSSNTDNLCKNAVFSNKKIKYQMKIKKINKNNKALADATFNIYSDKSCGKILVNGFKDDITTNKEGIAIYKKLSEAGTYYIKEVDAPKNYELSDKCYRIEVKDKNKTGTDSYAEPTYDTGKKGIVNEQTEKPTYKLRVKKIDYDTGKGISGVKFTIHKSKNDDDIIGTMTTDSEGIAKYDKLTKTGEYYIKEIVPNNYHAIDENGNVINESKFIKITITEDNSKTGKYAELGYAIKNKKKNYQLKIIKEDSVTKDRLSGVEFNVCYNSCNCTNPYKAITNKDGIAILKNLENKGMYCIQEITILSGYKKNTDTNSVIVKKEHIVSDNNNEYATITIKNQPNEFKLVKKIIDSEGKESLLDDQCGTSEKNTAEFQVFNNDRKLISFKTKKNGVYSANLTSEGKKVDTLKTCDGEIYIYYLVRGTYYIKETKYPNGAQAYKSDELIKVTIPEDGHKQINLTNGFIGLEFQKKDEDGKLISGGKFSLQKKINNIYKDVLLLKKEEGKYQYSDKISNSDKGATYELVTNQGSFYVLDLPVGEYRVVEKEAPDGYEQIKDKDSTAIVNITDINKDAYIITEMINKKISKRGSNSSAELIIAIITGRSIINYICLFSVIVVLMILFIYIRKKIIK